ncbi:MAG: DUF488 family protein [Aquihabitans sp.]
MNENPNIVIKRAYDPPLPSDARRILVDRLWPRGLSKRNAHLDEWCKDIAPTQLLRQWYGHDPVRFEEFRERYLSELDDAAHAQPLAHLRELTNRNRVTLLTASRDLRLSHARVLAERLAGPGHRPLHDALGPHHPVPRRPAPRRAAPRR